MKPSFIFLIILFILTLVASFFWLADTSLSSTGFYFFNRLGQPFYNFFKNIGFYLNHFFSSAEIYQRNIYLENQLREKDAQILSLKEALKENEIKNSLPFEGQNATVLMTDPQGAGGHLIINKGLKDNVKEGANLVIANRVLVGRVIKVYEHISKAETLISPNLKIGGQDSRSGVLGLVESSVDGLYFKLLPSSVDILVGDTIVTSIENKQFIRGLIIGEVVEVIETGFGTKSAKIKPAFNWSELDKVMILNIVE